MDEIKPDLVDELLKGYEKPEDIIGENGLLKRLTKALLERAMNAELTNHLGYEKHDPAGNNSGNSRNGTTSKTVKGEFGEMVVETPRDRNSTFEPRILGKHQTRFEGFDDKILSMYARGMTTREIQGHLQEMYGVEVSPTLISDVTDAVLDEVKGMAESAAGSDLRSSVPGRALRENAARRTGGKSRRVCGDGDRSGRPQGSAGVVDQRQ